MLFSIGIPAYKAKYLEECIASVLNQKYVKFELIILNDASPDNIENVVSLFNDPRIKYYKNEFNVGAEHVVDNWNKCLSYAKGDYFVLLGDDDMLDEKYLEEFKKLIKKYPKLDVYHCRSFIINENSNIIDITSSWPEFETVYDNIWHRTNALRQQYISDFVYSTKFLKNINGFYKLPLAWGTDDITAYLAMQKKGIAHTNSPIFNYRRNSLTISTGGSAKLKMEATLLENEWFESFLSQDTKNQKDNIIKASLNIFKYIQKKKVRCMVQSYSKYFFKNLIYWIKNKQKNKVSYLEILYSTIEYKKSKYTKKN